MLVAGIPKPRSKFTKFYFYFMRFFGPFLIFFLSFVCSAYYIMETYYKQYRASTDGLIRKQYFISMAILIFPSLMVIISLGYTILGDPGTTKESIRRYKDRDNFITQSFLDSLPRCTKCGLPKPPRAHHCHVCGRCHLKMDHHCPSIGTCIALWNQQPFIVMLQWASIEIVFHIIATAIYSCITQSKEEKIFNMLASFALIISFFALIGFNSNIMKRLYDNTTIIEESNGEYKKYDIGREENVRQVFGSGKFRYYIPRYPAMTGFEWSLDEYCRHFPNNRNDSVQVIFPTI